MATILLCIVQNGDASTFIVTDFLYWQPYQKGTDYALTMRDMQHFSLKSLDFSISPGYRIGIGWQYNRWDLFGNWTSFYNRSAVSARPSSKESLIALWVPSAINGSDIWKGSAHWRLQYDVVDLELGFSCLKGRCTIRPAIGLRGVYISQHMRVQYDDVHLVTDPVLFDMVIRAKNGYGGAGLKGGVDLHFFLQSHWSVFGKGLGSVLYGECDFKVHDVKGSQWGYATEGRQIRSNLEGAIGIQWQSSHLMFNMAYEWIQWFGQNPSISEMDNKLLSGGLSIQGGTGSIGFKF